MRARWGVAVVTAAALAAASSARGAGLWEGGAARRAPAATHGGPVGQAWAEGPCTLPRVDRATTTSHACVACHDGSVGPDIGFQMRAGGGGGMSHPVTVEYGVAAARSPAQYAPASALPREVPLVNGRVECTSCHDGASAAPKHVVEVAQLCNACHRL